MLWLLAQLIRDGGQHNFHLKQKCHIKRKKTVKILWRQPFQTDSVQKLRDAKKILI